MQVVLVLAAVLGVVTASPRERRQVSGCFWWKGECDGEASPGQSHPTSGQGEPLPQHSPAEAIDQRSHSTPHDVRCNHGTGVCVPYYLCRNNAVVTDGSQLIDVRVGAAADPNDPRASKDCLGFLEVCCGGNDRLSTTTTTSKPYTSTCGKRNAQGIDVRIQGFSDNQSQFGEFPWMVAVLKKERAAGKTINLYACGGSLIHPYIVLTVAHCVHENVASDLKVRLGEWDTQQTNEPQPHQDRDVRSIVIHHDYNRYGTLFNDFALLFLHTPAHLSYNVDTVCLGASFDPNSCLVTGWGKDKFGKEGVYQNVLKKVNLPQVPHEQCQSALRTTRLGPSFLLDRSFLCAGGQAGRDSCKGDGGSPLVCRDPHDGSYVQTGMVAWGIGCGEEGIPGVYANVIFGYDWIVSNANDLLQGTPGYDPNYWYN